MFALDLGIHTGWALHDGQDVVRSGVEVFDHDELAFRFHAWAAWLRGRMDELPEVHLLAFERVRHAGAGTDAAHHWGALYGLLLAECGRRNLRYLGINPTAVKRAAGLGSAASKAAIVRAAELRWPAWRGGDDEADARFVALAAAERRRVDRGEPGGPGGPAG
jgi:hypothetical protein